MTHWLSLQRKRAQLLQRLFTLNREIEGHHDDRLPLADYRAYALLGTGDHMSEVGSLAAQYVQACEAHGLIKAPTRRGR